MAKQPFFCIKLDGTKLNTENMGERLKEKKAPDRGKFKVDDLHYPNRFDSALLKDVRSATWSFSSNRDFCGEPARQTANSSDTIRHNSNSHCVI
ncbi:hypothetical protein QFZ77_007081 [Paenibacillus sp. V4I3]|nr:hypothetical protein [Paenibacillus sp. V4I3]